MTSLDTLTRRKDGKRFKPFGDRPLGFWVDIEACEPVGGEEDVDVVKWLGADLYVSATKGHVYTLNPRTP